MGREIRRVPLEWEHPQNGRGHYQPMYDRTLRERFEEIDVDREKWVKQYGSLVTKNDTGLNFYEFWNDDLGVSPSCYRPEFPEGATLGYCVYETISEGTPISPIFETLQEIQAWVIEQGYSEAAAKAFCESGFAFSMALIPGHGLINGIEALPYIVEDKKPNND